MLLAKAAFPNFDVAPSQEAAEPAVGLAQSRRDAKLVAQPSLRRNVTTSTSRKA